MTDIRIPQSWRKQRSRIYDYNRDFGGTYYQPMLDYMDKKERQGVFFERPSESIHFPDNAELKKKDKDLEGSAVPDLDYFLTKAYAQQAKEMNSATVKTRTKLIKEMTSLRANPHSVGDNAQTHFDNVRLLKGAPPGRAQCNYYTAELNNLKVGKDWRKSCYDEHMYNVAGGDFTWKTTDWGVGGAQASDKFYDPEKTKSIIGALKFVNPERSIPVV